MARSSNFEVKGYFPDKDCIIVDPSGNIVAQIGVKKEIEDLMESKDLYHIVVKPRIDQAFIAGVIATLDYIYGESTSTSQKPQRSKLPPHLAVNSQNEKEIKELVFIFNTLG
ncbi:protein LURP-one-related 6 [Citrus sinensis]|nr:protein LURP-one-related 6 [Citrus sinensis]